MSVTHLLGIDQCTKNVKLNSGYRIPLVGFGTYMLSEAAGMELAIDNALEAGYRLFDTAKNYRNEAVLGMVLRYIFGGMMQTVWQFRSVCPDTL